MAPYLVRRDRGETKMRAAYLPTNASLYYGITMDPAVALFFGWVSPGITMLLASQFKEEQS